MKQLFLILYCSFCYLCSTAQVREKQSINSGWQFVLNDNAQMPTAAAALWQKVNLPHTWNALDIVDDTLGYHQGIGWYKRELLIPKQYSNKHLELFFEGACNKATVYVNGEKIEEHSGGFTGFKVNLDGKLAFGKPNEILVKVDNGKYLQDSIPPFSGDFNLMGGIYRDVWLIVTNKTHFNNRIGNEGILFSTPEVSDDKASFDIRAFFVGQQLPAGAVLKYALSHGGKQAATGKKVINNKDALQVDIKGELKNPLLWSPEQPNLYDLLVQLTDKAGNLLDEISQPVGFKWVAISANKEFMLNGKPYKLKGASRHQDFKNIGNALTNAMHVQDIELMKAMGCNFIRIAHYPQDPAIYEACDRLGLIAWSEIPVVDRYVNNKTFSTSSKLMMQEMIWQQYNHPCIAIWGYHNEVRNLDSITVANAKELNSLAKEMDKQRLTAMAFESNIDAPYFTTNPLLKDILNVADINGYNVYQGWYRGRHNDIGDFLDTLYAYNPAKPIMLSEYGAGSITNIHSYQPTLFDFSEEYQRAYHESYVKAGNTKPWMIGFAIWNFIDFQRDGREDVVPNINKKGMVTTDRKPKDVFYFYKSQWSKEPFVYINGKHWTERIAFTGPGKNIQIPLVVYSNQPVLQLTHGGKNIGSQTAANGKFEWTVNVSQGNNYFLCTTPDGKLSDAMKIHFNFIDTTAFASIKNWRQLNFNTGQSRSFFTDTKSGQLWAPDKPYTNGTWGYVDGTIWNTWPSAAWNGIREGIHKPIALTENEPLFQTFVEGLTAWRATVPAGKYRVSLLLCEPFTLSQRKGQQRIFDIDVNGSLWMQQLDIEKQFGAQTAVLIDKIVEVTDNKGINIQFNGIKGKTIMNGISIQKL